MRATEFLTKLQTLIEEHGDLEMILLDDRSSTAEIVDGAVLSEWREGGQFFQIVLAD